MMQYINFQDIKNDHLFGEWRLKANQIGNSNPDSPFAVAQRHEFQENGTFKLISTDEKTGNWSVVYSDDMLKRPYVQFEIDNDKALALITRLKCTPDCLQGEMTLYLTTGLELELEKNS